MKLIADPLLTPRATPWAEVRTPSPGLIAAAERIAEKASVTMSATRTVKPQLVLFTHDNHAYRLRMTSYGVYVLEHSRLLTDVAALLDALLQLALVEDAAKGLGFSYAFIVYRCVLTTNTAPAGASERLGSSLGDAHRKALAEIEAAG